MDERSSVVSRTLDTVRGIIAANVAERSAGLVC